MHCFAYLTLMSCDLLTWRIYFTWSFWNTSTNQPLEAVTRSQHMIPQTHTQNTSHRSNYTTIMIKCINIHSVSHPYINPMISWLTILWRCVWVEHFVQVWGSRVSPHVFQNVCEGELSVETSQFSNNLCMFTCVLEVWCTQCTPGSVRIQSLCLCVPCKAVT